VDNFLAAILLEQLNAATRRKNKSCFKPANNGKTIVAV
jgi:hypothetical protein